jgi:hypothetical protein
MRAWCASFDQSERLGLSLIHGGLDDKGGFGGPPLLLMASVARARRSISARAWQRLWCSRMRSRQMQG